MSYSRKSNAALDLPTTPQPTQSRRAQGAGRGALSTLTLVLGKDASMGRAWLTRPSKPEKKGFLFARLLCKYCPGPGRKRQSLKTPIIIICIFLCSGPDSHRMQTAFSCFVRMKLTGFSRGDRISQLILSACQACSLGS